MLDTIREKIRALVVDNEKSGFQTFVYTTTTIFTIAQTNITIFNVLLDGNITDDYTFDEDTNKITITASGIDTSSVIEVDYTYNKYSDTELDGYIRSALVFISVYSRSDEFNYELEGESAGDMEIVPTMDSHIGDLVSLVASILIKPGYSQYNLPNLKVVYPEKMTKEERIAKLITRFNEGIGLNAVIQFDIYPYDQFPNNS
jgi:hypothetical protein